MSTARLVKRGRLWTIVISYLGDDGRPAQRWRSTGTSDKEKAEEMLRKVQMELRGGIRLQDDPTLGEWLEAWLARVTSPEAPRPLSPSTRDGYARHVNRDIVPRIGAVKLQDLRPEDCERLYADLLRGGAKGGKPMARATVRYVHACLRAALHEAERRNLVVRNVASLARAPQPDAPEAGVLGPADTKRLVAGNPDDPWVPFVQIGFLTGLRRGELLGLHWEDVDLDQGVAVVRRQRQRIPGGGGVQERAVKSKAGYRAVALPEAALSVLRAVLALQNRDGLRSGAGRPGHVFCHLEGGRWEPWSPEAAYENVKRLYLQAGMPVPDQPNHVMRHTHLSEAARAGMPLKDAQTRAGHSDPTLTIRVYQHASVDGQRKAAEEVAGRLFPAPGRKPKGGRQGSGRSGGAS